MTKDLRAPTDPLEKRKGFYLLHNLAIQATVYGDGGRRDELYMDSGRIESATRINGRITDESLLPLLGRTSGFRQLVHSIGVSISAENPQSQFTFTMIHYGHTDPYSSGTHHTETITANGVEHVFLLDCVAWSDDDEKTGQFAVGFPEGVDFATLNVRFYVHDGYDVPEEEPEKPIDFESEAYGRMIESSLIQTGNTFRLKQAIEKARSGEDVTLAYIGGSITQGAGAVPINDQCYAWKSFTQFRDAFAADPDRMHYVKAGIGGTSSELGVVRYDEQVTCNGSVVPDVVVVEFAVNDAGDETEGHCYEGLVRKIWNGPGSPAVILLFSVFADDYTLQDRFIPYGTLAELPMVSLKNALCPQFDLSAESGRLVSRPQYFYDSYHPSNTGHRIMADCLMHCFMAADSSGSTAPVSDLPVYWSSDFEKVRFFDRRTITQMVSSVTCGSFIATDTDIQAVQRNFDRELTPMFPHNWMYDGVEHPEPFECTCTCRLLMIIQKDSGSASFGTAEVFVDGKPVRTLNPREIGWTHSNALILIRDEKAAEHQVRIVPQSGKNFTILGFAVC